MGDLGTTTRPATAADDAPARTVRRQRTLPGGRAVVGAFLITAAAVGVFAAYLTTTAAPSTRFAVAARDIPPGTRITADMVALVPMDLPAAQASAAVTSPDRVVGRVALGPVRAGDLLQGSTFLAPEAPTGTTGFTFAIPSARALAGSLVAGDRIDVVATYGDTTGFVARSVPVVRVSGDGTNGALLVTIAVGDPATVLDIANALDNAQVHLARTDPDVAGAGPPAVSAPLANAREG
jgi:Flp pilus assembly protein CpaB